MSDLQTDVTTSEEFNGTDAVTDGSETASDEAAVAADMAEGTAGEAVVTPTGSADDQSAVSESVVSESAVSESAAAGSAVSESSVAESVPAEPVTELSMADQRARVDSVVDSLKQINYDDDELKEKFGKYLKEIERYQSLLKLLDIGDENLAQKAEVFLEICENPEFEIAFVGTIKTGKSTLINALLGHNYTPVDVTPETAALTKFRKSPQDYVKVIFYNRQEWDELTKSKSQQADTYNELYRRLNAESVADEWVGHEPIMTEVENLGIEAEVAKWTSSKKPEHFFVKEVDIGLSTLPESFPEQVLLVDTPGLFDAVTYRSEITKKYIRKADAVFFCVDVQRTIREEHEEIRTVFENASDNMSKVHIVATHWDKLNKPIIENWERQKKFLVELFSGRSFFGDMELAQKNIMHSSAYMYNLLKDADDNMDELEIFCRMTGLTERGASDEEIKAVLDDIKGYTNVDKIREVIKTELLAKYKHLLFYRIETVYQDLISTYRRGIKERKEAAQKNAQ